VKTAAEIAEPSSALLGDMSIKPRRLGARARRYGYAVAAAVIALALWQAAVESGLISRAAVASPVEIARAAAPLITKGETWAAVGDTIRSWSEGLGISLVVAVPLGLLTGANELLYKLTRFSFDFLRTIPPVAIVPLALLLYGATNRMALVLIVFGSVWPMLLQSMYGVHQVDAVARDVARAYRFRLRDRIFRLVLPSAAPFVATGVRIAATMSLLLAVGAELIGGAPGIGYQITLEQQNGDIPTMFVFVVASALLGLLVNLALINLERRALKWHSAQRLASA
jgi:ABC-type nitrate/sulfonate/bicarbonate transport system permease component